MADKEKKNKKDVPKTVTGTINEKGGILGKMLTPRTSLAKYIAGKGKKEKEAPKPVQGAGNMPLDDKQAAQQVKFLKSKNKEKEMRGMKKMNMGGMTSPMMGASGAPESGRKKPMMMPPKPKPAPRAPYDDSEMGNGPKPKVIVDPAKKSPKPRMKSPMGKGGDMPRMKKGGKVRGAGMAKKGVRACKMR